MLSSIVCVSFPIKPLMLRCPSSAAVQLWPSLPSQGPRPHWGRGRGPRRGTSSWTMTISGDKGVFRPSPSSPMESGLDEDGLHSPPLGGYTATGAPPNTPHGAQGSSTTPSGLPHDSGLGQDPHGSPRPIAYLRTECTIRSSDSQPTTAYNGMPQMHGHSIMPQYNIAPQHMHAYAPRYPAAAIPYQMSTQHSAVIQQAGHMGAQWMHTGPQYGMLGATMPNAYAAYQPGSAPPGYPMPHNASGAGTQSAQWVPPSPSAMPHANQPGPVIVTDALAYVPPSVWTPPLPTPPPAPAAEPSTGDGGNSAVTTAAQALRQGSQLWRHQRAHPVARGRSRKQRRQERKIILGGATIYMYVR